MNVIPEKHAPTKKRYARASQASYMNKKLKKEIMKWSCLRNKFLNGRSKLENHTTSKEITLLVY